MCAHALDIFHPPHSTFYKKVFTIWEDFILQCSPLYNGRVCSVETKHPFLQYIIQADTRLDCESY